jgi:folate-binding protein YgfZ
MGSAFLPSTAMETLKAALIERDVVVARGHDARDYLQTQLTQDVVGLGVGECAWSFLLGPKSEIVALLRVTRTGDEEVTLDTEPGFGDAIRQQIDALLFRTDVTFSQDRWAGVAWRGEGSDAQQAEAPIVMRSPWPGVEGVDVIGPDVSLPEGADTITAEELDSLRIRLGWPCMADFDEKTTPAMTGLVGHTVSFTKGCYTGQEFVARVHYREASPSRRLVQVGFHPCSRPNPGDPIIVDGEEVGTLTTVSAHQPLALGYLKRSVEAPLEAVCEGTPICIGILPVQNTARSKASAPRTTSPLTLS